MDILAAGARARLHLPTATQGRERICRAEPQAARQAPSDLGDPLSELFTEEALSWRYHTTRPVGVHNVFYPDGTARTVGDTVHIQGPAGMVQHDAGQIVFNPDGSVAAIHGPHPQFEGQTFCFALLP